MVVISRALAERIIKLCDDAVANHPEHEPWDIGDEVEAAIRDADLDASLAALVDSIVKLCNEEVRHG